MKQIIIFIFLWSIFTVPPHLKAQESWSLEACIAYALENNLQLKEIQYSAQSGQERHRQALRSFLPEVSGQSSYTTSFGRSIDPNDNSVTTTSLFRNSYSINASLDLIQGFQRLNGISATRFVHLALEQEGQQEKYLLAFRIMQAYYDVLLFEELIKIAEDQIEISQQNCELVSKQIELGLSAGAELYEAKAILTTDQLTLTQQNNNLKAAKLQLQQEMNFNAHVEFNLEGIDQLEDFINKVNSQSAEQVFQQAMKFMPVMKARNLRILAAEKDLTIAKGALLPRLSLFAGYETGFFETSKDNFGEVLPFRQQLGLNGGQYLGLSLNIPLLQSGRRFSQINQSKIRLLQAENDYEIQKQELKNIINQLVLDHQANLAEFEQTLQQVLLNQKSFEIAQKRFEKGLINALELFTAKNLYASAQSAHLQVKMRLQIQEKTLSFYQGLPTFQFE